MMKDQLHMMNQSQMMSMSQQLPPVMNNNQNSQMFVNQLMNPSQMMVNQSLNRRGGGYGMWPPPQADQMKFQNPNLKPTGPSNSFGLVNVNPMGIRNNKNWKSKKGNDKWNNNNNSGSSSSITSGAVGGYNPPTLNDLQQQNRLKSKRYFPKKKYNHGGGSGGGSGGSRGGDSGRKAPFAPRNTTSFLIRAKKSGGITSLVSPCPVTPAVLPTPIFSPSREVLVDMAKEQWGVDGYGSMKGLIRLRSPGNDDEEEEDDAGSSESDVEEHVEMERRLDHDLSRFEMIYPNYNGLDHSSYNLENRLDDQDTHIAQLEEENVILKERMFSIECEFDDLRTRLQCLERQNRVNHEERSENDSENESESRGYGRSLEEDNEKSQNSEDGNNVEAENKQSDLGQVAADVFMEEDIQKSANAEEERTSNGL